MEASSVSYVTLTSLFWWFWRQIRISSRNFAIRILREMEGLPLRINIVKHAHMIRRKNVCQICGKFRQIAISFQFCIFWFDFLELTRYNIRSIVPSDSRNRFSTTRFASKSQLIAFVKGANNWTWWNIAPICCRNVQIFGLSWNKTKQNC